MAHPGSTPFLRARIQLVLVGMLGGAGLVLGCIVSDENLPCRLDCQCPEGQMCTNKVCKAGKRDLPGAGSLGGTCTSDSNCATDLVCVENQCGEHYCRSQCNQGNATGQCAAGEICEGYAPDGGTRGVCVP